MNNELKEREMYQFKKDKVSSCHERGVLIENGEYLCEGCNRVCTPIKKKEENTNYMHVGETIACGHCQPDKRFELVEKYDLKCDCVCHHSERIDTGWEVRLEKLNADNGHHMTDMGERRWELLKDFIKEVERKAKEEGNNKSI